jgi:hypothetical protein
VALDHRRKAYRKISPKIWAIMLLAIFVNAMLMEGLHHHANSGCKSNIEKVHAENQLDTAKLKCKICEVLKNHSHFFDVPPPVTFIVYSDITVSVSFVYIDKHPDAYILSAANKGPPSLSA